jgi:hypothetical protein
VTGKLYERTVNCKGCNKEFIVDKRYDPLCPTCNDKKERQEWKEWQKQVKQEEDPIEGYCNTIRGITPDYEISYEDKKQREEENWNYRKEMFEKEKESWNKSMEEMTKAEQKEEKRKRRLAREERKQLESDRNLKYHGTPSRLLSERIDKVGCECEAEQMRHGIFCDTCKLLVKVNDYILDLFKRESEGRGSII